MTVIDVNSGRNVGKGSTTLEETITQTNLEAAAEVVRQLRLRDIGGIIIIDFIDMDDERNRKAVQARAARRRWPATARKHLRRRHLAARAGRDDPPEHLRRAAGDHDRGLPDLRRRGRRARATRPTRSTIERDLRAAVAARSEAEVTVALHPSALPFFSGDESERLTDLEAETGKRVRLEGDGSLAPGALKVRAAAA